MKGTLYGVGVGPGDPELITLKALDVIKKSDLIAVADTGGEKTALHIINSYLDDHELLYCPMPMTRDEAVLKESHKKCADMLSFHLDRGKNIAFCTLGDPSLYSGFSYIQRIMEKRGYQTDVVAGVSSFCAAAAALNLALCVKDEPLLVLPASNPNFSDLLSLPVNKVIVKSGKNIKKIKQDLKERGLYAQSAAVEKCGMEGQKINHTLDDLPDDAGYFTVIIVKE